MMKQIALLLLVTLMPLQAVWAQSDTDTFRVRTLVGEDNTPPSTPTLLSATPVAPVQIDLTWTASSDNVGVAGYSIVRDGTPIASTTLTSFSDTGLSASTTYSYYVLAFDSALNYSTSSNAIATTTPDYPPPPPPPVENSQSTEGTIARVVLDELQIIPGFSTTSFKMQTALLARIELRWGRTGSYELGYVASDIYTKAHSILLTDLEPGVTYEYEIIGYTPYGHQSVVKTGQFTTLSKESAVSPANVVRFTALANQFDVDLSWQMPPQEDIMHVRIVRSHLGFPEHPQDGAVVYQGLHTSATDEGVLSQYSPVYYTAFVTDKNGNVSSGAVTMVYATTISQPDGEVDSSHLPSYAQSIGDTTSTAEATSSIDKARLTPDMRMPAPEQILLEQGSQVFSISDPDIALFSDQSFKLSIKKNSIAGHLKSIIVTLLDPTDNRQRYSFLLRINQDQSAYEAIVAPLSVVGQSRLVVEIYDYEAMVVASYQTPLNFTAPEQSIAGEVIFPDAFMSRSAIVAFLAAGFSFFLLLLGLILWYRRRRAEDKE